MNLEEITAENIGTLSLQELKNLRNRACQLYESAEAHSEAIAKRIVGVNQPIEAKSLLQAYDLVVRRLETLGQLDKWSMRPLDHVLLSKRLRKLDTTTLPIIVVNDCVVAASGQFVENPAQSTEVELRIDRDPFADDRFGQALEKRIADEIGAQTGLPVSVRCDADGLATDGPGLVQVIPLYDLLLVPRSTVKAEAVDTSLIKRLKRREESQEEDEGIVIEAVSKPYKNEHAARQNDPKKYKAIRRENNAKDFGEGIHVLWGVLEDGKTEIQSIHFDAKKFTVQQAKKWLKEHDFKANVEPAVKKADERLESTVFIKSEEERIVGGIVYTVGEVDSQGDYVDDPQDIWKALKTWMVKGHPLHFMHDGKHFDANLIECFQAEEKTRKEGREIPAGAWYIASYIPPESEGLWQAIKQGDITGFSMAGTGQHV